MVYIPGSKSLTKWDNHPSTAPGGHLYFSLLQFPIPTSWGWLSRPSETVQPTTGKGPGDVRALDGYVSNFAEFLQTNEDEII